MGNTPQLYTISDLNIDIEKNKIVFKDKLSFCFGKCTIFTSSLYTDFVNEVFDMYSDVTLEHFYIYAKLLRNNNFNDEDRKDVFKSYNLTRKILTEIKENYENLFFKRIEE